MHNQPIVESLDGIFCVALCGLDLEGKKIENRRIFCWRSLILTLQINTKIRFKYCPTQKKTHLTWNRLQEKKLPNASPTRVNEPSIHVNKYGPGRLNRHVSFLDLFFRPLPPTQNADPQEIPSSIRPFVFSESNAPESAIRVLQPHWSASSHSPTLY